MRRSWLAYRSGPVSKSELRTYRNVFVCFHPERPRESAEWFAEVTKLPSYRGALLPWTSSPAHLLVFLSKAGLRSYRRVLPFADPQTARRILNAWHVEAADELIATATVDGASLFVVDCALTPLSVSLNLVKPLRGMDDGSIRQFEIAGDGSSLHWPASDVHLDLEALRVFADPEYRSLVEADRLRQDARLGAAIRALRVDAGLSQSAFELLSDRQVRRIEGGGRPRLATLKKLAEGHGLGIGEYLDALAEELAPSA